MTIPTPYEPPDGHIICLLRDVPEDWEHRFGPEDKWEPGRERRPYAAPVLVEARPVRQPDPQWRWWWDDEQGRQNGVTSVGEMRGRNDLDQWEVAFATGSWHPADKLPNLWWTENSQHPTIVRRVS